MGNAFLALFLLRGDLILNALSKGVQDIIWMDVLNVFGHLVKGEESVLLKTVNKSPMQGVLNVTQDIS